MMAAGGAIQVILVAAIPAQLLADRNPRHMRSDAGLTPMFVPRLE